MTVAAVLFLMAVHTGQAEQVNMLLVMKSDHRALFIRRHPDLLFRGGDHRVSGADNIGRVIAGSRHRLAGSGQVAQNALGVVAPFTVTGETLTVICAFQTWLTQVLRVLLTSVTLRAGRNMSRWAVMVTGFTAASHLGHVGMKFMVKFHRLVKVGDFIDNLLAAICAAL